MKKTNQELAQTRERAVSLIYHLGRSLKGLGTFWIFNYAVLRFALGSLPHRTTHLGPQRGGLAVGEVDLWLDKPNHHKTRLDPNELARSVTQII